MNENIARNINNYYAKQSYDLKMKLPENFLRAYDYTESQIRLLQGKKILVDVTEFSYNDHIEYDLYIKIQGEMYQLEYEVFEDIHDYLADDIFDKYQEKQRGSYE